MNALLNISDIGYTANNNPHRAIRSGEEFGGIIPAPDWQEVKVKRNAKVEETVAEMQKLIRSSAWQTKELSKRLLGKDLYTTCGNIWDFLFSHIKYKEDDKGEEQLRTPALSWYLRTTRGIDCDDFSIFAGTILYNIGIPFYLRIARYPTVDHFQHVYVVVPQKGTNYITIDAVLDKYDAEKPTAETKDFLVMDNQKLNGIDVTVLSGIGDDDTHNDISGIIEGTDFEGIDENDALQGNESDLLGAIYKHLVRTRDAVKKYPHIVSTIEDPQMFGDMLDYGIKYWHTDKQEQALGILEIKEEEMNRLNGLDGQVDGYEDTQLFYGIEGLGGVSILGKPKVKKQFFKKVNQTVKSAKQGAKNAKQNIKSGVKNGGKKIAKAGKKAGKAIVKSNLVSVSARAGMLLAMKTNFLKIASKLKWGYLTQAEAQAHGFDLVEWGKAKASLTKTEHTFVDTLKGKAEQLKKAILTGRAGGLNGLGDDLGVVAAATATASLTAAMPFIKQIAEFVKLINLDKLTGKANKDKVSKTKKKADTMPEAGEDAPSAQPQEQESGSENSQTIEVIKQEATSEPSETNTESVKETSSSENKQSEDKSSEENNSGDNNKSSQTQNNTDDSGENNSDTPDSTDGTGAKTESSNLPATNPSKPTEEISVLTKIGTWVKDNPGKSALIVGGLVLAFTAGPSVLGLGKVNTRGKTKKGKKKNNPPKAISGLPKNKKHKKPIPKAGKKHNPKPKYKNKPRGRGNAPKQITL